MEKINTIIFDLGGGKLLAASCKLQASECILEHHYRFVQKGNEFIN
jgi:hypothetical protein